MNYNSKVKTVSFVDAKQIFGERAWLDITRQDYENIANSVTPDTTLDDLVDDFKAIRRRFDGRMFAHYANTLASIQLKGEEVADLRDKLLQKNNSDDYARQLLVSARALVPSIGWDSCANYIDQVSRYKSKEQLIRILPEVVEKVGADYLPKINRAIIRVSSSENLSFLTDSFAEYIPWIISEHGDHLFDKVTKFLTGASGCNLSGEIWNHVDEIAFLLNQYGKQTEKVLDYGIKLQKKKSCKSQVKTFIANAREVSASAGIDGLLEFADLFFNNNIENIDFIELSTLYAQGVDLTRVLDSKGLRILTLEEISSLHADGNLASALDFYSKLNDVSYFDSRFLPLFKHYNSKKGFMEKLSKKVSIDALESFKDVLGECDISSERFELLIKFEEWGDAHRFNYAKEGLKRIAELSDFEVEDVWLYNERIKQEAPIIHTTMFPKLIDCIEKEPTRVGKFVNNVIELYEISPSLARNYRFEQLPYFNDIIALAKGSSNRTSDFLKSSVDFEDQNLPQYLDQFKLIIGRSDKATDILLAAQEIASTYDEFAAYSYLKLCNEASKKSKELTSYLVRDPVSFIKAAKKRHVQPTEFLAATTEIVRTNWRLAGSFLEALPNMRGYKTWVHRCVRDLDTVNTMKMLESECGSSNHWYKSNMPYSELFVFDRFRHEY